MVSPRKPDTKRADFAEQREELALKFRKAPSDLDVIWALLNKDRLKEMGQRQWGFYRNTTLEMGDALFWTHKDGRGLPYYLEVCYLDLNNPRNSAPYDFPDLLREFPPFSVDLAGLAPSVVTLAAKSIKLLGKSLETVRDDFLKQAQRNYQALHLPLAPQEAWPVIEQALSKEPELVT
jgi:hypothetical protein